MPSAVVTIVVNGAIVSSAASARVVNGRVVAPLDPIVIRLATRAVYDPAAATVAIERGGRRIIVPVTFVENDVPYIELGAAVRRIGGSVAFDSPTKTLSIVLAAASVISTPAPFDRSVRQADATTVFTPAPPPATPRGVETGLPRPRRTAIPVVPSQPIVPPRDGTDLTTPRRSEF